MALQVIETLAFEGRSDHRQKHRLNADHFDAEMVAAKGNMIKPLAAKPAANRAGSWGFKRRAAGVVAGVGLDCVRHGGRGVGAQASTGAGMAAAGAGMGRELAAARACLWVSAAKYWPFTIGATAFIWWETVQ